MQANGGFNAIAAVPPPAVNVCTTAFVVAVIEPPAVVLVGTEYSKSCRYAPGAS